MLCMYFPPKGSMQVQQYKHTVDDMISFAQLMMQDVPARSIPCICTDLNDRLGLPCASRDQWIPSCEFDLTVGNASPDKEATAGKSMREFAASQVLTAVNTHTHSLMQAQLTLEMAGTKVGLITYGSP